MINMKIFIEYDNILLKNLSNKLYQLFLNNSYNTTILDNSLSISNKINEIKKYNKSFVLSNRLNNNNYTEIIYPLRDNNSLANDLYDNLSKIIDINKVYQLRSSSLTNLDYYEILRNINDNKAIMIKYNQNNINDSNLADVIFKVISNYIGNTNIYIVKSGDSLYSISKRFNTTVDEIKKSNNLTSNLLSIGQKLIIPNNKNNQDDNIYIVKSGDSLYAISKKYNTTVDDIKKNNNLTSNLLSIGQKLIIPNNNQNITYIVVKGDSLYSIAKKYNTTIDDIKKNNNLTNNLLSIGQKLIIKK